MSEFFSCFFDFLPLNSCSKPPSRDKYRKAPYPSMQQHICRG